MNQKLISENAYDAPINNPSQKNLFNWYVFSTLFGLKFSGQIFTPNALTTAQMDQIKKTVDKKYPVFLCIDTIPATSGLDEHWILIIGYDGDDFIVFDPWDGQVKRITSWGVKPQDLIYIYCWYEGPVPQDQVEMITYPKSERDWLIGRATVAKETAIYLAIDSPDAAPVESYTKAIAGIKSATTACQTSLSALDVELSTARTEIKNRIEQVDRIQQTAMESAKLLEAQIDALKKGSEAFDTLEGQYKGRIEVLEKQVDDAKKAQGAAQNETAKYKSQYESCLAGKYNFIGIKKWIFNLLIK